MLVQLLSASCSGAAAAHAVLNMLYAPKLLPSGPAICIACVLVVTPDVEESRDPVYCVSLPGAAVSAQHLQ